MVQAVVATFWVALLGAAAAVAWRKRAQKLQLAVSTCIAAWLASVAIAHAGQPLEGNPIALATVDVFVFASLLWLAMTTDHLLLLSACGFQLCAIGTDTARLFGIVMGGPYVVANHVISFAVVIAILAESCFFPPQENASVC